MAVLITTAPNFSTNFKFTFAFKYGNIISNRKEIKRELKAKNILRTFTVIKKKVMPGLLLGCYGAQRGKLIKKAQSALNTPLRQDAM